MVALPWSKTTETSFKSLDNGASFVLDVNGHKVVALKLSSKVVAEIAGSASALSSSTLSKLKSKMTHVSETDQWLTVTSIENPLLEDYDHFGALIALQLTAASGTPVVKSNVTIAGSIRI